MRRAVYAILGTAAATSALVTLKAQQADPPPQPAAAEAPAATEPSGSATARPGAVPAAPAKAKVLTGKTITTPYGPITVKITVTGDRITEVAATLPRDEPSDRAGPQLRQQALTRQSAKLDTVSGATYTSDGYRKSLQSALDQVKRG